MDNAQIEHELEDLETRLERLRALYEQYFLGLEKLEPTVLRKEVDRKLWVLRREQIRNTGLRFKFQMLIQRYNTYQQYWTRVVREIENGTYRRDIIKVAQRFGEKEAMTILGKRRAEQYKRLAANQIDRRNKRRGEAAEIEDDAAADRPSMPEISVQEEEAPVSLSVSDLEMIEDEEDNEAPTPPRGLPPVRMYGEPDMEALLMAATVGVTTWGEPPRAPAPAPPPPEPIQVQKPAVGPTDTTSIATPDAPAGARPTPPPAAPKPAPNAPAGSPVATAVKPAAAPAQTKPSTTTAAPAAKSRVAELAAQMRAKKQEASKPKDDLDLDGLFGAATSPAKPPAAATPKAAGGAASSPASPSPAPAPRFVPSQEAAKPAPAPAPVPSPAPQVAKPAPSPAPAPSPSPQVPKPPPARPAPAAVKIPSAPEPAAPKPAPAAPKRDDLSEQKMREIYAKYVGAKRAANESTAGITFDKLAASLRAQADKLKSSHPSRTIDFEVVTKDGKTALRPVVK